MGISTLCVKGGRDATDCPQDDVRLPYSRCPRASRFSGASTKFSSTEKITDLGHLVFDLEEASLKRFASVDYQLDATATVASPNLAQLHPDLRASVTLTPDGRAAPPGP